MNDASSRHRLSFFNEGRPAKRSRTEPTMVCCCSESLTPGAVVTFFVSMFRFDVDILAALIRLICEISGFRRDDSDLLQVISVEVRMLWEVKEKSVSCYREHMSCIAYSYPIAIFVARHAVYAMMRGGCM